MGQNKTEKKFDLEKFLNYDEFKIVEEKEKKDENKGMEMEKEDISEEEIELKEGHAKIESMTGIELMQNFQNLNIPKHLKSKLIQELSQQPNL
jgi:hypothetical protein